MLLTNEQTVKIGKLLDISVEKRWYLTIEDQVVSSLLLASVYGVNYPTTFCAFCEEKKEAVVAQGNHMAEKIKNGTGKVFHFEPKLGYRILKNRLGIGSKYDVDVNAKEVHAFPEELHRSPPVIFLSLEEAMDVTKRLIRYAAQTILVRGKWGGVYCKQEIKHIIKNP